MSEGTRGPAGARRRARRDWTLGVGLVVVVAMVAAALLAPVLSERDPLEQNLSRALQPPAAGHPFGTDELGRDLFSRTLHGGRVVLLITFASLGASYVIALPMGLVAGFYRGRLDAWLMAASDSVLTFPSVVLAIVIVSVVGPGVGGLILAITASQAPAMVRFIRGIVFPVREIEYVTAARAVGAGDGRIVLRHVLPATIGPSLVVLSLYASQAVLITAALGFIGLGVQPPAPEWGTMLSRSRHLAAGAPHLMLVPGIAISLLVLGLNLLGDGLRDRFDPRGAAR